MIQNQQQLRFTSDSQDSDHSNPIKVLSNDDNNRATVKSIALALLIIICFINFFHIKELRSNHQVLQTTVDRAIEAMRMNRQMIKQQESYRISNQSSILKNITTQFSLNINKNKQTHSELQIAIKKCQKKLLKLQQDISKTKKILQKQANNMQPKSLDNSIKINGELTGQLSAELQKIKHDINNQKIVIDLVHDQAMLEYHQKKVKWLKELSNQDVFKDNPIKLNFFFTTFANMPLRNQNPSLLKQIKSNDDKLHDYLSKKYNLEKYQKELPFCLIVPTYNNAKNYRYEYNLNSIINLNYTNYQVVVIDDASNDTTYELIKQFIEQRDLGEKFILLKNEIRMTAVPNIDKAIRENCDEEAIAVLVDGDDEILGKDALQVFNSVYQSEDVDVVYSNHLKLYWQTNSVYNGWSLQYTQQQKVNNLYRDVPQKISHLRSFKISLYLQIDQKDLKDDKGQWFRSTYDQVICLPILQLSCGRISYIQQYFYLYNFETGTNDIEIDNKLQKQIAETVKFSKKKYKCNQKRKR